MHHLSMVLPFTAVVSLTTVLCYFCKREVPRIDTVVKGSPTKPFFGSHRGVLIGSLCGINPVMKMPIDGALADGADK